MPLFLFHCQLSPNQPLVYCGYQFTHEHILTCFQIPALPLTSWVALADLFSLTMDCTVKST